MTRFTCSRGGTHDTLMGAKYCDLPLPSHPSPRVASPTVPAAPVRGVVYTSAPATEAQRAYAVRLGGRIPADATRAEASRIIDSLKSGHGAKEVRMEQKLDIPPQMIFALREARYAVSIAGGPLNFVRLSLVQERRSMAWNMRSRIGWMKVQTQHSEDLIDRAFVSPEGKVELVHTRTSMNTLRDLFLAIIVDERTAAIRYGQELGQCCRCGKTLTDERSRYYGIGPDCEGMWPEIIDEVDENQGVFVPSRELV